MKIFILTGRRPLKLFLILLIQKVIFSLHKISDDLSRYLLLSSSIGWRRIF